MVRLMEPGFRKLCSTQATLAVFLGFIGFTSMAYADNDHEIAFSMPILKECKMTTMNLLDGMKAQGNLKYIYTPFDVRLISHESLIGYVRIILNQGWGAGFKQDLIDRIINDCYPNTSSYIDRTKVGWGEELENVIPNLIEQRGKIYIGIDKKNINIYYNVDQLRK